MNIHIKTSAKNCHIAVYIKLDQHILLSLVDNDEKFLELFPQIIYTFEWHAFVGPNEGYISIQAEVTPANEGFSPLDIEKDYPAGSRDGNTFDFTLEQQ